ncbi:MAG TPA: carboxypeptidase-like regulatory domain-containing protein [Pyrinomonadaceae bacterium]|nr:carboxypeptidase-like regulatory domain-containing protein [Pyrinomonadaceae bacterium]
MKYPLRGSLVLVFLILLVLPGTGSSQDPLKPNKEKKAMLHVVVTGGDKTRPVNGADVTVRSGDGAFAENTNTNVQGAATVSNVPFGSIVIQITAQGWKTHGRHIDFKEEKFIQVNLESNQTVPAPEPSPTPR